MHSMGNMYILLAGGEGGIFIETRNGGRLCMTWRYTVDCIRIGLRVFGDPMLCLGFDCLV